MTGNVQLYLADAPPGLKERASDGEPLCGNGMGVKGWQAVKRPPAGCVENILQPLLPLHRSM